MNWRGRRQLKIHIILSDSSTRVDWAGVLLVNCGIHSTDYTAILIITGCSPQSWLCWGAYGVSREMQVLPWSQNSAHAQCEVVLRVPSPRQVTCAPERRLTASIW